jgi:hypothetical protein
MSESDVRIGEVVTEIVVTEGIGPLGPEEVRSLVALVLEHVKLEQHRQADRTRDTELHDRVFNG